MSRKPINLEFKYKEQQLPENLNSFYATGTVTYLENNIVELRIVSSNFNLERIKNVTIQQIRGNVIETFDYINVYTFQFENIDPENIKVFLLKITLINNIVYTPIKLVVVNTPEHVCENSINWYSGASVLWHSHSCVESLNLNSYLYDNMVDEVALDDGIILITDT